MTHRTDIGALPVDATFEEVVSFINKEKYSRIPVYEDNIDNIVGVLHAKYVIQYLSDDEARKNFNIRDITSGHICPDSKRTDELFKKCKRIIPYGCYIMIWRYSRYYHFGRPD
jgi:putative hemolysin